MNLLAYTKKISDRIKYYDSLTKRHGFNMTMTNPFASKPLNLTVIWVENNEKDCG